MRALVGIVIVSLGRRGSPITHGDELVEICSWSKACNVGKVRVEAKDGRRAGVVAGATVCRRRVTSSPLLASADSGREGAGQGAADGAGHVGSCR
jgi:hypothetical protein